HLDDVGTKCVDAAPLNLFKGTLRNDERTLPVIVAIEHHENTSEVDAAEELLGITAFLRQPHPERIHRRAEIDRLKAGCLSQVRIPTVGSDDEIRAQLTFSSRRRHPYADDPVTIE